MSPSIADQLARRATGALFFSVFGSAWLALFLYDKQWLTLATSVVLGFILLVLVATGIWVRRRTKRLLSQAPSVEDEAQARKEGRMFGLINAVQWGAIYLAGWLLPKMGLALYFTPVVALLVGLHFFPLARLFRYGGHYLTGGAMLLWTVGCLLLASPAVWQGQVALGTGPILWLSAAYSLNRAVWLLK